MILLHYCGDLYEVTFQWALKSRLCKQPEESDHQNHMTDVSLGNQVTPRLAEVGAVEAV